jgi:PTH2 family peptidyl-tRNA hydrolase
MSNHYPVYPVKQVLLVRTDLKNKQGQKVKSAKMGIQMAHAAMIWVARLIQLQVARDEELYDEASTIAERMTEDEKEWLLNGSFAKIALGVEHREMLELVLKAQEAGLKAYICTDAGRTEFEGPTETVAAIGPARADVIDLITGHLRPL